MLPIEISTKTNKYYLKLAIPIITMLVAESLCEEAFQSKEMEDTRDEADETLSFCDLPLYSDQSVEEWEEDLSAESHGSSSMSSSEQDYFEFFSQELVSFPPEDIIFCGKLIPYKQQSDSSEKDSSRLVESKRQKNIKKKQGWGIFRWKFSLTRSSKRIVQSKTGEKSSPIIKHKKGHHVSSSLHQSQKKTYNSNKYGKGYNLPVQKMSVLTSISSGKARWYLFSFGISRFSTEVDLRDMKSRQSRRHFSSPPPSPTLRFQNHHDNKISGGRNRGSGLWGLIRLLSCSRNHHPNTMVVSTIGCTPQE